MRSSAFGPGSTALAGIVLWLLPLVGSNVLMSVARAWSDAPLCEFPRGAHDARPDDANAEDDALGMCAPGTPHLVRSSTFDTCAEASGRAAPEQSPLLATDALARARKLDREGSYEEALLNLRVVEATMPRIADHVAFMRAELHERNGDYERAAAAYTEALEQSPDLELRARARVGRVRSLLRAGDPSAEAELQSLQVRYPELPEAPALKLELARHRELTGQPKSAIAIYRAIDLQNPGYPMAAEAREHLSVLAGQGHVVLPFSELETLQRSERLMRSGPLEQARATFMELRERAFSKALVHQRDLLVLKFDELEARRFAKPEDKPAEVLAPDPAFDKLAKSLLLPDGAKALSKLPGPPLLMQLKKAARLRLTEVADALVRELARRERGTAPELRFEALAVASGTASDGELVLLADTLIDLPSPVAVPARYHRARALERNGNREEALLELQRVAELDSSPTRFYANWAEQRLRELQQPDECRAPGRANDCNREAIEATLAACDAVAVPNLALAIEKLAPLAATYDAGYPWLGRALDLARIGETERASDELHEAYLAWRFVARRGALRAGREAVYRGVGITRAPGDPLTHRARLQLRPEARSELALVASALGDWGTAVDFGGSAFAEQNAHPYAGEVARAARIYGLDPDLLFAVMRVESVYQRRIISHAGAIGLMQIMPRTGRLIADKLGHRSMTATDLLDPRTNIEFSAWYFSSLLTRMDGRLPLAIASYNGGPHNVRAWIRHYGTHVPLDAFLERIPFTETKRYVRRVLGYYNSYKAERGQHVDLMATRLPGNDQPGAVSF
ncbi:MAG: Soluble lytic murein transglycosylase precursor [Myxococcaceae bacterium]|nr:Soluble lytic murein transglycosylase precursor [Myxococcaceae bacterium]